jgi:DNA-binding transcriptional LysR family regulator
VPIGQDAIVAVLPPGHPLAAQETIDLATCVDQRWAFDVTGSYMSDLATRLCREAGFEPRVICRFNNYMITLQHVEAGLSVALLPSLAVDPRFDVVVRGLRAPVPRRITAAVRRPRAAQPVVNAVLGELRAHGARRPDAPGHPGRNVQERTPQATMSSERPRWLTPGSPYG